MKHADPEPHHFLSLPIPDLKDVKFLRVASDVGGTTDKYFFTDSKDQMWLVKVPYAHTFVQGRSVDYTYESSGQILLETWKVASQVLYSNMTTILNRSNYVPVHEFKFNDTIKKRQVIGTIQYWLGDGLKTLRMDNVDTDPRSLSSEQKLDFATDHVIDWLLSNHDSTGSNYLVYRDRIIPVDKEHCFCFLLPTARYALTYPDGDALDLGFPIKQLTPVYAHKFWGLFAQGELDFDPRVLRPIIEAIDAVSEAQYLELLAPFLHSDYFVNEQPGQEQTFLARAIARKRNVRTDFERFLTILHRARAKPPAASPGAGRFTFADGWDAAAAGSP
jgi:hypothetical protein